MAHAQEQDQPQQLVFQIQQFVIKRLPHTQLIINANHGIQVVSLMDLDVFHHLQLNAI